MSKEDSKMTAHQVAQGLVERAKQFVKEKLEKAEMDPKSAAQKIKGQAKVNEILPKVAPEKRGEVLKELRMDKADPRNQTSAQMQEVSVPQPKPTASQPKAIAKQPLQLKKFMEKCSMKKGLK